MSILAECQPFAHHDLGETRAKPPASGLPPMGRVTTSDHIHVVWIWSKYTHLLEYKKGKEGSGMSTYIHGGQVKETIPFKVSI
jgi:hypothetical protein